jgi:HSP20 family protein
MEKQVMTLTRYSTRPVTAGLPEDFKTLIDKFFGDGETDQSNVVTSQWMPRVDIKEEPNRFLILADIPGVDPKEIEVHMEKGILSIRGERKTESKQESEKFTRVERSHGVFYRRFALPDSADPESITAKGSHGVLEIAIPKKPETTPRRISIAT